MEPAGALAAGRSQRHDLLSIRHAIGSQGKREPRNPSLLPVAADSDVSQFGFLLIRQEGCRQSEIRSRSLDYRYQADDELGSRRLGPGSFRGLRDDFAGPDLS